MEISDTRDCKKWKNGRCYLVCDSSNSSIYHKTLEQTVIELNPETAILLPTQLGLLNLHSMPAPQPLKKTQFIHKIIHVPQTIHVYFMTKVNLQLKLNTFCNSLSNQSTYTVDECGKGAWWNWREPQASLEGNHENPVSDSHQAPSHISQWRNAQILTKGHPEGREGWERNSYSYCKQSQCEPNDWLVSVKALSNY